MGYAPLFWKLWAFWEKNKMGSHNLYFKWDVQPNIENVGILEEK